MRIYFVGAPCVGKSTLATMAADLTGLPLIDGAVFDVMNNAGLSWDDVSGNLETADQMVKAFWSKQALLETKADRKGFVAAESFDAILYAEEISRVAWSIGRPPEFDLMVDSLRDPDALVFFVRPCEKLCTIVMQRRRDLKLPTIHRIDGAVQSLLETREIQYVPVTMDSLRDRYRLVKKVVSLLPR